MACTTRVRTVIGVLTVLAAAVPLGGCGLGAGTDETTRAEELSRLEGRPLSDAEVDEIMTLAGVLCGTDGAVLDRMWAQLDAQQLELQDYIFGQVCPERADFYQASKIAINDARVTTTTAPPTTLGRTPTPRSADAPAAGEEPSGNADADDQPPGITVPSDISHD
ncbi:MAG: hypothetical protein ACK5PP_16525 [Acidimicrobiales bacterium]